MTEPTPTAAASLRADVTRDAIEWHIRRQPRVPEPTAEPDQWRHWAACLNATLFGHGLEMALAALAELDPGKADTLAAQIAAEWEDPPAYIATLFADGGDMGVVDGDGHVLRDGKTLTREEVIEGTGL